MNERAFLIQHPVDYIQSFYSKFEQKSLHQALQEDNQKDESSLRKKLKELLLNDSETNLQFPKDIPRLNECQNPNEVLLLNHKLVRFDCMIQDQFEDEFFYPFFPRKQNIDQSSSQSSTSPSKSASGPILSENGQDQKESKNNMFVFKYFSDLSKYDDVILSESEITTQYNLEMQKCMLQRSNVIGVSPPNYNKWVKQAIQNKEGNVESLQCLIKLYDSDMNSFKLNDQITFIGILEFKPISDQIQSSGSMYDGDDDFMQSNIPNEHLIPHLHAIHSERIPIFQHKDLLKTLNIDIEHIQNLIQEENEKPNQELQSIRDEFFKTNQKILAIFNLILKGDEIASQFLLLNLISYVHTRTPEQFPLGNLSINLYNLQQEQAQTIQNFLQNILAVQISIKLTTESLSEMRFQPKKNYDTQQMEPSLLQMIEGTNVICDETHMNEGKIEKNGVHNIKALAELIEDQKIVFDFQYMSQDFPISSSVLILSGGRSMFKNSLQVPFISQKQISGNETQEKLTQVMNDKDLIRDLRRYFLLQSHLGKIMHQNYALSQECLQYAQEYFIRKRKEEAEDGDQNVKTDQHVFHHWLTIARLITVSQGLKEMNVEQFKSAIEIDNQRIARISSIKNV